MPLLLAERDIKITILSDASNFKFQCVFIKFLLFDTAKKLFFVLFFFITPRGVHKQMRALVQKESISPLLPAYSECISLSLLFGIAFSALADNERP